MLRASLIYFVIRVLNGVVAFATLYVLTHALSIRDYGAFALGVAAISVAATVMFEWIAVGVSRFYANHADYPGSLLREAYRLFVIVVGFGVPVIVGTMLWMPPNIASTAMIAAISLGAVLAGLYSIGLQIANARRDPVRYGLMSLSRGLGALACAVLLARLMSDPGLGAVIGVVMGYGLAIAFLAPRSLAGPRRPETLRKLVSYGAPLTLTYLAARILDVSDRFMLASLKGSEAVAG
ncbi:MAG: oligosaccharide flippase family protein, partial [Proteobacteria bacterium]|nr:oligosaccharide flippase family protein [Pseudomonadota bacterium]